MTLRQLAKSAGGLVTCLALAGVFASVALANHGGPHCTGTCSYGDADQHVIGSGIGDSISVNGGNDIVEGRDGGDNLDGGSGGDALHGEGGNDFVIGGLGGDSISGGGGNDTLYGQDGPDGLSGLANGDQHYAGGGNDAINAQDGTPFDIVDGGANTNYCSWDSGDYVVQCIPA